MGGGCADYRQRILILKVNRFCAQTIGRCMLISTALPNPNSSRFVVCNSTSKDWVRSPWPDATKCSPVEDFSLMHGVTENCVVDFGNRFDVVWHSWNQTANHFAIVWVTTTASEPLDDVEFKMVYLSLSEVWSFLHAWMNGCVAMKVNFHVILMLNYYQSTKYFWIHSYHEH